MRLLAFILEGIRETFRDLWMVLVAAAFATLCLLIGKT